MYASEYAKSVKLGNLSLEHVSAYARDMSCAGIQTDLVSPLILPSYAPEDVKLQQMARLGNTPARHSMLRTRFGRDEGKTAHGKAG